MSLYRSLVAILADAVAAEIAESALLLTDSEGDPAKSAAFRFAVSWHRLRKCDDAMIRSRKQMTISELKRAMDRRFDRLERTKVGKAEFRKLQRAMERRFDRLERTKADKVELHTLQRAMERRFDAMEQRFDRLERTTVNKSELESSAAETRRHFDVVAESIRAEMRLFGDPIGNHTDQINQHETRIARLERRSN